MIKAVIASLVLGTTTPTPPTTNIPIKENAIIVEADYRSVSGKEIKRRLTV